MEWREERKSHNLKEIGLKVVKKFVSLDETNSVYASRFVRLCLRVKFFPPWPAFLARSGMGQQDAHSSRVAEDGSRW
jgi:hypothetical protein